MQEYENLTPILDALEKEKSRNTHDEKNRIMEAEIQKLSKLKAQAVFIASVVAAFTGAFVTHQYMFVGMPAFALDYSILAIAASVVGGMGTLAGPALGAFILVPLSEILRTLGPLRIVFYGIFLVVFVVAIPEGLFHYMKRKYYQFEHWVKV